MSLHLQFYNKPFPFVCLSGCVCVCVSRSLGMTDGREGEEGIEVCG